MITSAIGKKFLKTYNEKCNTTYDAKTFFIDVFYPLFFNHKKYLMTAGNSPLENPKLSWDKMILGKVEFESPERRLDRFNNFVNKVELNNADASIAVGYPSLDVVATTSGQISNLTLNISKDDIYFSWIGAGLGVGVQGGNSILFDDTDLHMILFEGWQLYREILNANNSMKGNQINTWNAQWLCHRLDSRTFEEDNPSANFDPFQTKDGLTNITTTSWTSVLIAVAKAFPISQMLGYVYNHGQTNTTVGFIPFSLTQIRKPIDLYLKLFGMENGKKAEPLWGTAFGFSKACQAGVIGLHAMKPKGLEDIIKGKKKVPDSNKEEQLINYNTYLIWIMAMLNNEELWAKAQGFANELHKYSQDGERGKKVNSNKVEAVMSTTNKSSFIKALTDIVADATNKENIEETALLINSMPSDNVPYFLTLIKFHYASINNNQKK